MHNKPLNKLIFAVVGFALVFILTEIAKGAEFKYADGEKALFKVTAVDLKAASKACFQKLTRGEYPGEEIGLKYIDICANPKK